MTKAIFFFIATLLLLLPIVFSAGEVSLANQLMLATPFILVFGIPHGAVDNVIYRRNHKIRNSRFILNYLMLIGVNILAWTFVPLLAYLIFLLLSAYHFGQSQFSHYFEKHTLSIKLLFVSWGVTLLSGLLYLNITEVLSIINSYEEFQIFGKIHQEPFLKSLFYTSTLLSVGYIIFLGYKQMLSLSYMFMELLVLGLILSCFYLLPLIIGFTLYFIILHSYKVLREEYEFLSNENEIHPLRGFVQMVAPFTLFSIMGIALTFGFIYLNILSVSYGYSFLIIISSITLPHVFVMNTFYRLIADKSEFLVSK